MKSTKTIYWIFTILLAIGLLVSSLPDLMGVQKAMEYITNLGYPAYMINFISIAKIFAAIAILIPGFPRVKEWAYAGVTFDFAGAMYSQAAKGVPIAQVSFMLIWFAVLFTSYIFYHKKLRASN